MEKEAENYIKSKLIQIESILGNIDPEVTDISDISNILMTVEGLVKDAKGAVWDG